MIENGAYLAERIRSRCVDDGECLVWSGAMARSGSGPFVCVNRKHLSARRIIWEQKHGTTFPKNRVAAVSCLNKSCLHEDHVIAWTRLEVAVVWHPQRNRLASGAKLATYRRSKGKNKLTVDDVALIRSTSGNRRELAEKFGVAVTSIDRIRRGGGGWRDYGSPFAGLGSRP